MSITRKPKSNGYLTTVELIVEESVRKSVIFYSDSNSNLKKISRLALDEFYPKFYFDIRPNTVRLEYFNRSQAKVVRSVRMNYPSSVDRILVITSERI